VSEKGERGPVRRGSGIQVGTWGGAHGCVHLMCICGMVARLVRGASDGQVSARGHEKDSQTRAGMIVPLTPQKSHGPSLPSHSSKQYSSVLITSAGIGGGALGGGSGTEGVQQCCRVPQAASSRGQPRPSYPSRQQAPFGPQKEGHRPVSVHSSQQSMPKLE
jgi:hypothetical protein